MPAEYKILVVDNEPRITEVLGKFLTKSGFEVIKASGGREAIELLRSGVKIDLLVMDMKMPGVSGIDVLKEKKKSNNNVPVLILTGSVDAKKHREELEELGCMENDVVYKPIEFPAFLDAVKKKLGISP